MTFTAGLVFGILTSVVFLTIILGGWTYYTVLKIQKEAKAFEDKVAQSISLIDKDLRAVETKLIAGSFADLFGLGEGGYPRPSAPPKEKDKPHHCKIVDLDKMKLDPKKDDKTE